MGAEEPTPQSDRETHRAGADDQYRVADLEPGTSDSIQPHCQGFNQGSGMKSRGVRQGQGFGDTDPGEFRIGAGQTGACPRRGCGTAVRTPRPSMITLATADERLRDNPLPAAKATSGVLAKFDDLA